MQYIMESNFRLNFLGGASFGSPNVCEVVYVYPYAYLIEFENVIFKW